MTTSGLPELVAGRRAVLIAGPLTDGTLVEPLVALAEATGVPILADPLSGLRAGTHDRSHVIGFGDALAQAGFLDRVGPEAALRFGPVPVSKAINTWLASNPQVDYEVVDSTGWSDPGGTGRQRRSDPAATAVALAGLIDRPTEPDWLAAWQEADVAAGRVLSRFETFSELSAIDTVLRAAPEPATIWVASSMPIRQVDLLLGKPGRELRLLGNRGASGIDGFVSSALGSATATGERTIAIAGDLSLLYDLTALAWAARHRTEITIVVINNDGGGIFSLLPQADLPEFEELFGTPHGLDFADAALWAGVEYTLAATDSELGAAVSRSDGGPHLIEARFERSASAVAYGRAVTAVADALAAR